MCVMRAIEPPARVMMTVNTDRMKSLQTNTFSKVRAMRSVFRQTLRHEIVLLAASDQLTSTRSLQSRPERR
jgi:hypothetical protein